jgi:hypothetical protein
LSACGSDGPGSMNKSDAQAAFTSVNSNVGAAITDLNDAPGTLALNSFADLSSSASLFGRISSGRSRDNVREQIKRSLNTVRSMLTYSSANAKTAGDESFDFDSKKGKYYYNFTTGEFDKDGTSEYVQIYYPSEGSSSRDTEFRLTKYIEEFNANASEPYNPTLVEATVYTIDENYTAQDIIAKLELTADYDSQGEPIFGDIDVTVTPFKLAIKFDDRSSTSSSASQSLSKDGKTIIAVGASATFYTSDKDDPFNIKKASAYLQLMNVKFILSYDLESADENTENISDLVRVSIKIDGKDAGRIVFDGDIETELTPYVKYKDGTEQPLEEVFGALAAELEDLFPEEEPM